MFLLIHTFYIRINLIKAINIKSPIEKKKILEIKPKNAEIVFVCVQGRLSSLPSLRKSCVCYLIRTPPLQPADCHHSRYTSSSPRPDRQ